MQESYAVRGRDSQQNNSHKPMQAEPERKKMDRRDELISEMVTDRVLGMRMENGIISGSMPRDNEIYRKKGSITGGRPHEGRFETSPRGPYDKSLSKSHLSRIVDPLSSSLLNPLNVSELTELSYDQFGA